MKINNISPISTRINNGGIQPKKNNNMSPSFGAKVPEPVVNGLANFYDKIAQTNGFQKFIKAFSHSNRTFTHLLVAESCFLSGFYMINTLRNKKIDKKQKPQMVINDALTLGVSTVGAYLAEDKITHKVADLSEKYFAKHKDFYEKLGKSLMEKPNSILNGELMNKVGQTAVETGENLANGVRETSEMVASHLHDIVAKEGKQKTFQISGEKLQSVQEAVKQTLTKNAGDAEKAKAAVKEVVKDVYNSSGARAEADKAFSGINKLKVLVIFGLIYRYIGPVVITPIANKLSSKFFSHIEKGEDKKTETKESK